MEKLTVNNGLCLLNQETATHIDPATGSLSIIDLAMFDPAIYLYYVFKMTYAVAIIFPFNLRNGEVIDEHPPSK